MLKNRSFTPFPRKQYITGIRARDGLVISRRVASAEKFSYPGRNAEPHRTPSMQCKKPGEAVRKPSMDLSRYMNEIDHVINWTTLTT